MSAQVSIHASAREATSAWRLRRSPRSFQSTPPHGRRRELINECLRDWTVSIHASAREATPASPINPAPRAFQSTPPHGRRLPGGMAITSRVACFNPRLRTGGDDRGGFHTNRLAGFNPRLRTGGDSITLPGFTSADLFQSTPPHGRRLLSLWLRQTHHPVSIHASAREATRAAFLVLACPVGFNPRLRTGGDYHAGQADGLLAPVSIHASAREATGGF